MSEYVYAGLTSQTIDIFLQDSSSATGEGLTGLVYNSAGLVASYRKGATGSRTALSLATQTVGGTWSSGGFVEIDATNMPGIYRLDIPNTVVDTEGFVTLYFHGATNLLATPLRVDCRAVPSDIKKIVADAQSATDLKDFADAGYDPSTNTVQGDWLTSSDITKLLQAVKTATLGVVGSGSTTTSIVTSSLLPAAVAANQFKGLIVKFTDDTTTTELRGQGCEITSSSSGGVLTVSSLTTAPVSGDTFVIQ